MDTSEGNQEHNSIAPPERPVTGSAQYHVAWRKKRKEAGGKRYEVFLAKAVSNEAKNYDPVKEKAKTERRKVAWAHKPDEEKKPINEIRASQRRIGRQQKKKRLELEHLTETAGHALLCLKDSTVTPVPATLSDTAGSLKAPPDGTVQWGTPFKYAETRVIPPSTAGIGQVAIDILLGFQNYLSKNTKVVKEELYQLCHLERQNMTGVRTINGGRYEIFMKAPGISNFALQQLVTFAIDHPSSTFPQLSTDEVMSVRLAIGYPPASKNSQLSVLETIAVIQHYSISQAQHDPRCNGCQFNNFAFILTYGNMKPQDTHIDLFHRDHLQCALMASTKNHATSEFRADWEVSKAGHLYRIWKDVTPELVNKIGGNRDNDHLLSCFGSMLSTVQKVNKDSSKEFPDIGCVTTLPGKVPHRGPASKGMRMVLFFTATPTHHQEEYDVDVQYGIAAVLHDLLVMNWISFTCEERAFMLRRFSEALTVGRSKHFTHCHIVKMAKDLLAAKGSREKALVIDTIVSRQWTEDEWSHLEHL